MFGNKKDGQDHGSGGLTLDMLFDLAQHPAHISLRSPPTEILPDINSDILFGILSELAVRVQRGTLRSSG